MGLKKIDKKDIINKIRKRVPSNKKTSESLRLGMLLAIVGGFLDAYTFISRGGVFANAQTGNMVLLALGITNKDYKATFMVAIPIIAFIIGVLVTQILNSKSKSTEEVILIIEAFVLFIIGFIPKTVPDIIATSIIAFVSSVQIASFRKLVDFPYSTTMCTANLRTFAESTYLSIIKKDKAASTRAIRYSLIIISFLLGASLCGILTINLGVKSIWACSVILVIAKVLFNIDEYRFKKRNN